MKQVTLDVIQPIGDTGIESINHDHETIFHYIDKLQNIASQPKNHEYAIIILENLIGFFLEHVIKEEQQLQQYLPANVVEEHALLHQRELIYLDQSLKTLKARLSSDSIQAIAVQLNKEFKSHIYRYDTNIMQKLMVQKAKLN